MANGYALVDQNQVAVSWHPSFDDATLNADFERRVYARALRIVKDTEATWPEYRADLAGGWA